MNVKSSIAISSLVGSWERGRPTIRRMNGFDGLMVMSPREEMQEAREVAVWTEEASYFEVLSCGCKELWNSEQCMENNVFFGHPHILLRPLTECCKCLHLHLQKTGICISVCKNQNEHLYVARSTWQNIVREDRILTQTTPEWFYPYHLSESATEDVPCCQLLDWLPLFQNSVLHDRRPNSSA